MSLLEAALAYAKKGWRVFPVTEREKTPHRCLGKAGWTVATTNEAQIATWWTKHPDANVGLVTGGKLGVVLDIDRREALGELGQLPRTRAARTGSGGLHLFYRLKPGVQVGNARGALPKGIDVRGEGSGYIVAPPSIHPSGGRYEWAVEVDEPAFLPERILQLIRSEEPAQAAMPLDGPSRAPEPTALERARKWLATRDPAIAGQGGHNVTLRTAVGLVRGFMLDEGVALELLVSEYNPRCQPAWSRKELAHKVREAAKRGDMVPGELLHAERRPSPSTPAGPPPRSAAPPQQPAATSAEPPKKEWKKSDLFSGFGTDAELVPVGAGVKDAPDPEALVPYGYYIGSKETGSWWLSTKRQDEDDPLKHRTMMHAPLVIGGRMVDIDTGSQLLSLHWRLPNGWRQRVVPRSETANANKLLGLADFGLPVNTHNSKDLSKYLGEYEAQNYLRIPEAQVATTMGWQGDQGSKGFLWGTTHFARDGRATECDLETTSPSQWTRDTVSFRNLAEGDRQFVSAMRRRGSLDGWLEAVGPLQSHPRAALCLYAAFTSVLLEVLGAPNFILDWANRTRTGKSTVLRVAASVWGDPDDRAATSYMKSWDSSLVSIERTLEMLHSLPLILDDTARVTRPEGIANVLYMAAQGQGRGRGNIQRTERTRSWRTVVLSSGEQPAVSFSQHGGTRSRCLEVEGPPFGGDEAHHAVLVERITQGLLEHHGHAGPLFVAWLLEHRKAWPQMRADYQDLTRQYVADADGGPASAIASIRAALSMTHRCVNLALGLDWQDPVAIIWDDLAADIGDAAGEERALEDIVSWLYANEAAFIGRRDRGSQDPPAGWLGYWPRVADWQYVAIYRRPLDEYLRKCGYQPEAILKAWKQKGWLITDGDKPSRLTKDTRVPDKGKSRMVCLPRRLFDVSPESPQPQRPGETQRALYV